ncbi:MAG: hypothetical protein DRN01_03005 [Thermoplasmata archaeon]|nr:MAG: hypothetical protein DRP55_10030 [Spirochaetota bacterium]RLF27215.1 MAG: hypothetical protein DRN01_03005 [Thermoplasmata archaeon]
MSGYTEKGLVLIILSLVLTIILNLTVFFTGFYSIGGLNQITGLLTLIGLILMFVGRKEYGVKHQRFVVYAVVVFLIAVVFSVIYLFYIAAMIFSAVSTGNVDFSAFVSILYMVQITAILGGLVNVFLLHELESWNGRIVLYAAFVAVVFTSILVVYAAAPAVEDLVTNMEKNFETNRYSFQTNEFTVELQKSLSRLNIYGVINSLLFLVATVIAYRRVKSGEVLQVNPTDLMS